MESTTTLTLSFVAIVVIALVTLSRGRKNLPPGPPADPLIGHLRVIPTVGQEMFFYELGKRYGDVVQLRVLGQSLIVLNSVKAAVDLLEKRSSNYSDRPDFPFYNIVGVGDTLLFSGYGKEFRFQRRMAQQYLGNNNRQKHHLVQTREARILSANLINQCQNWRPLLTRFSTAILSETIYGHQIVSDEDTFLKIVNKALSYVEGSGSAGSTPLDLFPILRYLPTWFPGTHYAQLARDAFPSLKQLREYPLSQVMAQMRDGTARPSFLLSQLETFGDKDATNVRLIQAASAILYLAGAETTASSLAFFVLAMVLYPECQRRAQEEIASIIGSDRLPEFYDRPNLPYVECIMQETLRWNQAAPIAMPHKSLEDDVYNGMFIPKGSTIIPNIRGMTLDDSTYADPFKFDPTRFLPVPDGREEPFSPALFGFGRRICPGRFLADDSLWIAIATMLAANMFLKALDDDGKEIIPDGVPQVTDGITCHPVPFQCRIEPRTMATMELLKLSLD